jgi:hypothetical protein
MTLQEYNYVVKLGQVSIEYLILHLRKKIEVDNSIFLEQSR